MASKSPRPPGPWALEIATMPNPDFGETAKPTPDTVISAETYPALRDKARAFIEYYNLGGGHWFKATLSSKGAHVGWMSYNLRAWDRNPWEKGHVEIFPKD